MKSAKRTTSRTVLAIAAVGTALLVGWRSFAVEAVCPAERARRAFVVRIWSRVVGAFRGAQAEAENARLKRELGALEVLKGDLARLQAENARLRRSLGYAEQRAGEWIAAEVLSSGGGAAGVRDVLRVGKGARDGVVEGAVVVVPEGLVGRVTEVSHQTAEVALLTDGSVKVACEIGAPGVRNLQGILSGGGDDLLFVRYLGGASRASVRSGSGVFTSGGGGVFPRGIAIGTLHLLRDSGRGLEGEVRPSVDFSTLEDVFIRREK